MVPTRKERKESITKMRKQQILDAALKVFSRKSFAEATTAEIAREAGYRTKIAVYSSEEKIDCVGACVGLRGSRVKNIETAKTQGPAF